MTRKDYEVRLLSVEARVRCENDRRLICVRVDIEGHPRPLLMSLEDAREMRDRITACLEWHKEDEKQT